MKKNKLILLQLFVAIVLICSSVYATISTTIELKPTKTTLKKGETFAVTLALKGVESDKRVVSVSGYINYDTNIIEDLKYEDIQKDADNTVTIGEDKLYVEDFTNATVENMTTRSSYVGFNGKPKEGNQSRIVIDFDKGVTSDTDLLTINFKVKEDAKIDTIREAIKYSTFVITAGGEKSEQLSKSLDIQVVANDNAGDNQNENKNNNTNENENKNVANENTNDNTNKNENKNTNENTNKNENKNQNKNEDKNENKNENKNKNSNSNKDNNTNKNANKNANANKNNNTNDVDKTVAGTKLPSTGAKIIIVPAIVLIVLAVISYREYRKMKGI